MLPYRQPVSFDFSGKNLGLSRSRLAYYCPAVDTVEENLLIISYGWRRSLYRVFRDYELPWL
jgi:hypothetical protein